VNGRGGGAGTGADHDARLVSQTVFDRPLVLEAGAGTGKTATLVARVLAWCLGPGWRRAAGELAARQVQTAQREAAAADRIAARVLDGVVAITFTEAAAAEMAERIARALAEVQRGATPEGFLPEALALAEGEERERAAELLVAFDHVLVATIHGFCRRLLAGAPLEAGLHPGFTVDADGLVLTEVVQESVEAAFRRALADPDGSALFALLARGVEPPQVAEAVISLAGEGVPADALAADPFDGAAVGALAGRLGAHAEAVRRLLADRFPATRRTKNARAIAEGVRALTGVVGEPDGPATLAEMIALVQSVLPDNLVKHLDTWGGGEFTESESVVLGDHGEVLPVAAHDLAAVARHVKNLDPELLDVARRALLPLLAEVHRTMRTRGAQTFAALLGDAAQALEHHPRMRARVRSEITQMVVDEFQDTDPSQCEILRFLALDGPADARPGLFLIGDPKQSIYGWRDADLAAYESFVALVRQAGGEILGLTVNYRSLPAILAEVDRVVRPVMRHQPGVQPAFQVLLPCPKRTREAAVRSERGAEVEYWVSWTADPRSPDLLTEGTTQAAAELEATAVAADIREHHAGGAAWREFGVLLRSTGDIDVYLQALRDADVPYLVERDRSYYRRREIIDAAALVRAVVDPGDHLALVTVLRSALVGVPDAALVPLWSRSFPDRASELGAGETSLLEDLRRTVLEIARALPGDVPGIGRVAGWETNLVAFLGHLAELRVAFREEPSASFVEKLRRLTLFEATEAARTLGAFRVANLDRFFRTLLGAMEAAADPHAVLRALRAAVGEGREAEEGRPLIAAEDAVRVMTVHKAKGLDFTHVYLVQAQKRPRGERRPSTDAARIEGHFEYALFGAVTPGWWAVEERRRRVAEAELVRTLYVAMTRARDRLVIAGAWPAGSRSGRGRPRSHMDLLARRETLDGGLEAAADVLRRRGGADVDGAGARWSFPVLRRRAAEPGRSATAFEPLARDEVDRQSALLEKLRGDARARQARVFAGRASEEAHERLGELLADDEAGGTRARRAEGVDRSVAIVAGAAVHQALEELDLLGDLGEGLARARRKLPDMVRVLTAGAGSEEALRRSDSILARLVGSRTLARLAAIARDVVARELPVLLPPDGRADGPVGFVAGTIDLVFRDPARGDLVIVDYKTDEVSTPAEIANRATAYAPQALVYRRALLEALVLGSNPRCELWFLAADHIVKVAG
jgi:ATP-dependent helicase/nuclease subunit A